MNTIINSLSPSEKLNSFVTIYKDGAEFDIKISDFIGAPASTYKVYSALLTQTGSNAPVATVLENTLNFTPSWVREGVGVYSIQNSIFELNKTTVNHKIPWSDGLAITSGFECFPEIFNISAGPISLRCTLGLNLSSTNKIQIRTANAFTGVLTDSIIEFYKAFIEIRVYN